MAGFSARKHKVDDKWKQFHSEQEAVELTLSPKINPKGFTASIEPIWERFDEILEERKTNRK